MRVTFAVILLATLQVTASNGNAQNVTLQLKQVEIPKVFKAIEKQSEYRFLYNYDLSALQAKVDVSVQNTPVLTVLEDILKTNGLAYRIMNNSLVVIMASEDEAKQQGKQVTGKVTGENGQPLTGVSVRVKGTTFGTATDNNGSFTLEVPDDAVLTISIVGYETQEVAVKGQATLAVVLKNSSVKMDEIVVVGYGVQKKKDVTGSVSVLSSKDLENRPNTQFGYAIQGKAAGVQVIRSSGQPQAGVTMRIRGTTSITAGSNPLFIVDGVPTANIQEINPADIENISVLKDASAAAIYGSGGANGVVIVTTKRGRNQKMRLGFNTSLTMSKAWKKMDVLNSTQFKELVTDMGGTTDWNKYNANTDWQDETFRNALTQNYQLSATGGTNTTSYYLSGAFLNQNGIILNNSVKRITLKANVDQQVTKFLKVGTSLNYSNWKDRDVPENSRNGVIARVLTTVPVVGVRDPDNPEMYGRSPFINDLENPVSTVYQPDHLYKSNRFNGSFYAEAEPIKGLKLRSLFGYEKTTGEYTSFQDSIQTRYGKSSKGLAEKGNYKTTNWISENTVTYKTKVNDHSFDVLGGFIAQRENTDNVYRTARDFSTAKGDNSVNGGAIQSRPIPEKTTSSAMSVLARLNYNYKGKYFLTSNFRYDGSGKFATGHKWGSFPSFSLGWKMSEEKFFAGLNNVFSELKLRGGWGIVGNNAVPVTARYGLVDTTGPKYLVNGVVQSAWVPTSLGNEDLVWEKTKQVDVGIDIGLLHNRVMITADYYQKKTSDMLLAVPIPSSTGYTRAWQNAGTLENKGFEFTVSSKNIAGTNFRWNTDFNISFNRNKVLNIVGEQLIVGAVNPAGSDYNTAIVKEGEPLGSFYGKISQGVDAATGNIIFVKKFDNSDDSVGIIGNANPKFTYGLSNSFTYKNFTLDIFLQGVSGNKVMNATRILTESMSLLMNQSASVTRRWKQPGDITDIPGVTPEAWDNSLPSTRYIESGSYMRIKSLTLGYKLPEKVLAKAKITRCFVYFTAENLLTITRYKGFDPELSAFSGKNNSTTNQNAAPGIDWGTYPQSRDFILGVNISF